MNKCLVTKLKATVDNPDLPFFGELVMELNGTFQGGYGQVNVDISGETKYTLVGDAYFVPNKDSEENLGKTLTKTGNTILYIKKTGTASLKMTNKYEVRHIGTPGTPNDGNAVSDIPSSRLRYCTKLMRIGDTSNAFTPYPLDFKDLYLMSDLRNLFGGGFHKTNPVVHDIESLVEGQIANGRQNGTLTIEYTGAPSGSGVTITFNNVAVSWSSGVTITYNSDGGANVVFNAIDGRTINGTYDGSSWSYSE